MESTFTPDELAALPTGAYAFPGPLRDRLVGAILSGTKTATTGLHEEYERFDEPLPQVGEREVVLDSENRGACVTQVTEVAVRRLGDVAEDHAIAEGEGHATVAAWRDTHQEFWTSPEFVTALGEPPVVLDDNTLVVCTRFVVIARL